jgi:hypothetical protein
LQQEYQKNERGRQAVAKQLANMANRHSHLLALSNDTTQLDQLADEINRRVTPSLSDSDRKSIEDDFNSQLSNMKNTDMSTSGAKQTFAGYEATALKDLDKLRDADRTDVRSFRREFSQARRQAYSEVSDMAKQARKSLRTMGTAWHMEKLMERAGKSERVYDHAEDHLQTEEDHSLDHIIHMHDHMEGTLDKIYSQVEDRVDQKTDALERDARSHRGQLREELASAKEKFHDQVNNSEKQQALIESSVTQVKTNTACMVLLAVGLAGSLVMNAMQRREKSRSINQQTLLGA